jgi:predicted permease
LSVALLLFPDFALILLGALLYRFGQFEDSFWSGLERIVFFVLFPALLFQSTATADFNIGTTSHMLIVGFAAFGSAVVLGFLAQPLFQAHTGERAALFASGVQTAFRFNSYIALAVAGRLSSAMDSSVSGVSGGVSTEGIALMAVLLGVHVPMANAAAVYALARHGKQHMLREMARNPLIIATVGGLLFNFLGHTLHFGLPEFVDLTLSRLGSASIALGLISVGAGLRASGFHGARGMIIWWLAIKMLISPAIALGLALYFDLPPLQRQIVVLFAALPTASSAFILTRRLGGVGTIVAFLISASTLISIITLPLWLLLIH